MSNTSTNIYIQKALELSQLSYLEILKGCIGAFIIGILIRKFLNKKFNFSSSFKNHNFPTDKEDSRKLKFFNLKMIFICKVNGKEDGIRLAKFVSEASVELYNLVLLKGNELHHTMLDAWDTYGSTKIVLKVKEEKEIDELLKEVLLTNIPFYRHKYFPLLALGPYESEKLNKITGHLKLLS